MSSIWLWNFGEEREHIVINCDIEVAPENVSEGILYDYGTAIVHFPMRMSRSLGIYRFRTAEANLKPYHTQRGEIVYSASLRFGKVADGKQLLHLIMDGKIWPEIDLLNKQVPPPVRHFRQLFREAWGILRREVSAKFHATP